MKEMDSVDTIQSALDNIRLNPRSSDKKLIKDTCDDLHIPVPRIRGSGVVTMTTVGNVYERLKKFTSLKLIKMLIQHERAHRVDNSSHIDYYINTVSLEERKLICAIILIDGGKEDVASDYIEKWGLNPIAMLTDPLSAQYLVWIMTERSINYFRDLGWSLSITDLDAIRRKDGFVR